MAKSKEQKQQEALERKRLTYIRDDLYVFCGKMPGGSHWIESDDPHHLVCEMITQCKILLDKAKELKLTDLTADSSTWGSMISWDPIHIFRFLIGRKENLLELIRRMHVVHQKTIPEGDVCRRDLYGNGIYRESELNRIVSWAKVNLPDLFDDDTMYHGIARWNSTKAITHSIKH